MKRVLYILFIALGVVIATSCSESEDGLIEQIESGNNLISFFDDNISYGAVADGEEYQVEFEVFIQGPTTQDASGDVTVTLGVDPSSTAVEGTHFRLDEKSVVLKESDDYRGIMAVTMLTDGIQTPLDVSPELVLKMESVTGADKVIATGKTQKITLDYACPSFLAGSYTVAISYEGVTDTYTDEVLVEVGIGVYQGTYVAKWGDLGVSTGYGIEFKEVCGITTVPTQNLAGYYSNDVHGTQAGSVDPETGVITIYYFADSGSGAYNYTAVYTPN